MVKIDINIKDWVKNNNDQNLKNKQPDYEGFSTVTDPVEWGKDTYDEYLEYLYNQPVKM